MVGIICSTEPIARQSRNSLKERASPAVLVLWVMCANLNMSLTCSSVICAPSDCRHARSSDLSIAPLLSTSYWLNTVLMDLNADCTTRRHKHGGRCTSEDKRTHPNSRKLEDYPIKRRREGVICDLFPMLDNAPQRQLQARLKTCQLTTLVETLEQTPRATPIACVKLLH